MIEFSFVKLFLFIVYIVQITNSQDVKITKCLKSPDTWTKVDKAVKECQEDVKLNLINDAFQAINNGWDDSFFDHDEHIPWESNQSEHKIEDHHHSDHDHHSQIQDNHHSIHDNHDIHDHHSFLSEHSPIHDHHSAIYNQHSSIHEQHSSIHDHHSSIPENHPSIHEHPSSIHEDHPSIHNPISSGNHYPTHNHDSSIDPPSYDHQSSIHNHHPSFQDHQSSINNHHSSIIDHPTHDDHYHRSSRNHPTHGYSAIDYQNPSHLPFPHGHTVHQQHEHQIELPQLKIPQHLAPSTHKKQQRATHSKIEHVKQTDSLSDNPVEHSQHIDMNDFRKKRDASDYLGWIHPSTVTYHDKRIAGCIMQCIYKKNHAVDQLGWPTLDGLVNFYSEGVNEHGYFMATLRAVDYCLKGSSAKYHVNRRSTPEKGQTCDVAFDVFDCISDRITEYCSDSHHPDSSHIKM